MTTGKDAAYDLVELNKEQTLGGIGTTKARDVPRIDMSGFEARKTEIADQLWQASTEIGFFQLINHGIPQEQIDEAFTMTEHFFALPHETKAHYPLGKGTNAGWEYKSQVRPSTGTADQKESYQITVPRMAGLWPSGGELPGFKAVMLAFERANWALGMKVLSCFALKLGFAPDFFTECHDPLSSEYQSTLRLLHYLPMVNAKSADFTGWRAGAHTDFDCLTLLHQRAGQGGLQLCPGKDFGRDRLDRRRTAARRRHLQYRRHADALERRQAAVDAASGADAADGRISRAALFDAVFLSGQQGRGDPGPGQELPADHRARLSATTHRRELREVNTVYRRQGVQRH